MLCSYVFLIILLFLHSPSLKNKESPFLFVSLQAVFVTDRVTHSDCCFPLLFFFVLR